MAVVDGALVVTTTAATGTNWHVQIYKAPVQLENGVEYVIRFKMKSPDSCSVIRVWPDPSGGSARDRAGERRLIRHPSSRTTSSHSSRTMPLRQTTRLASNSG